MENLTTDPETLAAAASVAAPSTSTTSPASNMEVDENNKDSPTNKASTSAPGKFPALFWILDRLPWTIWRKNAVEFYVLS